jgi:excisionase family DNA binding protein
MYLTRDTARILNVNPATVWREIQRGNLKAHRVGSSYRIAEEDLVRYLSERRA